MVTYLFNTLLFLNLIASSIYLLFKSMLYVSKERIDEKFRYIGCIVIMILFLIPFYQIIPIHFIDDIQYDSEYWEDEDNSFEYSIISNEKIEASKKVFDLNIHTHKNILFIWCIGASSYAWWYLYTLLRFRRQLSVKKTYTISDELQRIANCCAKEYEIKQFPILKISPDVESPMLIGFIRPIIVIPDAKIELKNAKMIFMHELMHFKRCDLWWKLVGILLKTIYWFNPIVWLLCKDFEFYAETSCDAEVVKNFDHDERKSYGYLLISYVQTQRKLNFVQGIPFTLAHEKLKRRISVMIKGNKSQKIVATAIVCVLAVSSFGLSTFAAENHENNTNKISGIVAAKDDAIISSDKIFNGEVQNNISFAEKINPDDGWNIENKDNKNFDTTQTNLPPLNIPDDFREDVMQGKVEPFEIGEGVTVFTAE